MKMKKNYNPRITCPVCDNTLLLANNRAIKNATTAVLITEKTNPQGDLIIRCKHCKNDIMLYTDRKKYEKLKSEIANSKSA